MKYEALRLCFITVFFFLSDCLGFLRITCTALDGHNSSVVKTWQGWAEVDLLHASFCFFTKTTMEERKQSQNRVHSFSSVCLYLQSCCWASTGLKCFSGHQLRWRFKSCALRQGSLSYWKEIREQDEEGKKDMDIVKGGWRGRSEQEGKKSCFFRPPLGKDTHRISIRKT